MASSTCPRPAKATPRLLWAIQQSGFLSIVVRYSVSTSAYIRLCRQVRPAKIANSTQAQAHRPARGKQRRRRASVAAAPANTAQGTIMAAYCQ